MGGRRCGRRRIVERRLAELAGKAFVLCLGGVGLDCLF